ncbi:MAG: biotin--[acetyl-CoA-carboxylase] ligase [Oscillospiraceae bacterium]|nr:biotin--[acetyl-CoA-carboxylase] ligase [Oscillospiraceae bacterium]
MALKDRVLALLEDNRGSYLSGEEIARQLGVSRNSVWKAVRQLQSEGHGIDGVTNRGYALRADSGVVSVPGIMKYLRHRDLALSVYPTVTSTNTLLKQAAEDGTPEGTVFVAEEQTAGRGRLGRSFYSPAGTGIYFSILLRPSMPASESLLITTGAAVACAQALEAVSGVETQIKWVNDIYAAGKKVCGILTEASMDLESGGLHYAVLGIGVNLLKPDGDFPEDIRDKAGALFSDDRDGDIRCRIVAEVLDRFLDLYAHLTEKRFLEEYRRRSMLTGQSVDVLRGGTVTPAVVEGIDDAFALIVRYADGRVEHLGSGDVSVRKNPAESPKFHGEI